MAALAGIMVLFGIILAFAGPAAFILALVCLNKINQLERRLIEKPSFPPAGVERPTPVRAAAAMTELSEPASEIKPPFAEVSDMAATMEKYYEKKPAPMPAFMPDTKPSASLEQIIGTRWILIAGVISVIAGVGFFLKYAYDNMWLGPWARVCVAAAGGAAALILGEITRRRGYEIVAKGVTALGFAILYAAVFSAYRVYNLVGAVPAFSGAIVITIVAMAYAVVLDEVLIAFLSLLGGFATPLLVSTDRNMPNSLFGYVLVLSCGAMLCAMFRRWRAVNIMAFVGTFLLYTLWFEKFLRPILPYIQAHQDKILVAEGWLGVFFVIYMVLPLLYGFVKKVQAYDEDVVLPGAAGVVCFYYLWTMLAGFFRTELAVCAAMMGIAYLVTARMAFVRCKEDRNLQTILTVAGVAFITAALPLYFKTNALVIGWTIEAVILIAAGVIYGNYYAQILGFIVTGLSLAGLYWIDRHTGVFTPVFNGIFGTWMFAAAGVFVSHLFYRYKKEVEWNRLLSEIFFVIAVVFTTATCCVEWGDYWESQLAAREIFDLLVVQGGLCAWSVCLVVLVLRPVSPGGKFCRAAAAIVGGIAGLIAVGAVEELYCREFRFVLNTIFAAQAAPAAALFIAAILLRREKQDGISPKWYQGFALAGVILLWGVLSQQAYSYWDCRNQFGAGVMDWQFKANLSLSLLWAGYGAVLLVVGFWKQIAVPRYLALGLFGLLLVKVFIVDTATVKSVYRIAAFLATGLTLVGVSYLYQFLKKKGFFEAIRLQ